MGSLSRYSQSHMSLLEYSDSSLHLHEQAVPEDDALRSRIRISALRP